MSSKGLRLEVIEREEYRGLAATKVPAQNGRGFRMHKGTNPHLRIRMTFVDRGYYTGERLREIRKDGQHK